MKDNSNEKMLQEMLSTDFLEVSREQIEGINGGVKLGAAAVYAVKPPKDVIIKIIKAILDR